MFTIKNDTIYVKNIFVDGEIHILNSVEFQEFNPLVHNSIPELKTINENLRINGNLFISCENTYCYDMIAYAMTDENMKKITPYVYYNANIKKNKTFNVNMNISSKENVVFESKTLKIFGDLRSSGDITMYSDKVLVEARKVKINKLIKNING